MGHYMVPLKYSVTFAHTSSSIVLEKSTLYFEFKESVDSSSTSSDC